MSRPASKSRLSRKGEHQTNANILTPSGPGKLAHLLHLDGSIDLLPVLEDLEAVGHTQHV